jgi:RNA polymerase sigma-70 factor (ECF subfamily)
LAVGGERLAEPESGTANSQRPTANPEGAIVDRQALKDALSTLSEDHREVVLLHEVEGLTYQEAAEVLGVPEGTVKSRLHHAFLNLRRALLGPEEVTA